MAVNKRKVLDAARKYAQKGAKQKALKEYNALLKLDARDAKLRLEIGDAHRRWGEHEEAIGHYTKVADQYVQDGFDARAVAVYKQILNLDPKRYSAFVALSDLYQRMGLEGEAIGALQTAADGYHREGQKREALELLRKMAQLDPSNTTSRLKVASLLRNEGLDDDAATEFEAVAEELVRQGESDEAENVYQKVLELQPRRVDILVKLARNAIEMRSPERAETWARRATEVEENEAALELLCDVYKALENSEGLVDASRRLARIYRDRGDEEAARTIMQRLPTVEPIGGSSETSEVDALELVEEAEPASGPGDDALLGDDELLGDEAFLADDGTDVFEFEDDDALGLEVGGADPGPSPQSDPASAPAEPEATSAAGAPLPEGEPDQLLAEASVYLRYGKLDQAVANLRAILRDEPGHRGALEKLGEALAGKGDEAAAVSMWRQAAERAREEDDADGFDVLRSRIEGLDPDAAAALPPMESAAAADEGLYGDSAPELPPEPGLEQELSIDLDLDLDAADEDDLAAPPADRTGGGPSATRANSSSTTAVQVQEEIEEAEFFLEQGMLEEAAEVYRRILEIAPNHPSALLRIGEIAAQLGEDPAEAAGSSPDDDSTLQDNGLDLTVDIAQELIPDASEEAAFAEESGGAAEPAGGADDATRDGAEITRPRDAAPARPAQAHEDDSFDLAAELSDVIGGAEREPGRKASLQGTEEEAFASLFESFKRGVNETLAEGDHETRYDLAIAYKEMGLLEDAIAAFQACVQCPERGLDSLQLLAQCALDVGRPSDAIGHLQQALSWDGLEAERRAGLMFDLGRAHADTGDTDRARATFETVSELSPSFPGLEQAVAELLERAKADSADRVSEPSTGETFESFDDLVAEATAEAALLDVKTAPEATPAAGQGIAAAEAWIEQDGEAEEPIAEAVFEAEPVADDEPPSAADESASGNAPPRKRKKKISFV